LTHDPIGYVGGVNLFEYVGGNPVRFVDPEGAEPITISSGIGLIDLAIGSGAIVAGEVLLPAIAGVGLGAIVYCQIDPEGCAAIYDDVSKSCNNIFSKGSGGGEHTKGARPSTIGKHEKGKTRKIKDYGKEKADENRRYPRKPPGGKTPKGGWPPEF